MTTFLIAAAVVILWRPVSMALGFSCGVLAVMTYQAWRVVRWLAGH